jgi:hypothetical protein
MTWPMYSPADSQEKLSPMAGRVLLDIVDAGFTMEGFRFRSLSRR